jgi:hypothetical protein
MKATLEFDLHAENSDDRIHLEDALNGGKWKLLAWDLDQYLRSKTKYAPDDANPEVIDALYDLREHFHQMRMEANLSLE